MEIPGGWRTKRLELRSDRSQIEINLIWRKIIISIITYII